MKFDQYIYYCLHCCHKHFSQCSQQHFFHKAVTFHTYLFHAVCHVINTDGKLKT